MYAERRIAFEARIKELMIDHFRAYPAAGKIPGQQWWDLRARVLSALEDSFQMGRRAMMAPEQREALADKYLEGPMPIKDEKNG